MLRSQARVDIEALFGLPAAERLDLGAGGAGGEKGGGKPDATGVPGVVLGDRLGEVAGEESVEQAVKEAAAPPAGSIWGVEAPQNKTGCLGGGSPAGEGRNRFQ